MTEDRAQGVHELLQRLGFACACERTDAEIIDLYGVAEAPQMLRAV